MLRQLVRLARGFADRGDFARAEPLLREAQLWLLKDGKAHPGLKRGLRREGAPPLDDGRLPPYYWAAFILSGDWR